MVVSCRHFYWPQDTNHVNARITCTWVHHVDAVTALALSRDGSLLYSASWDRTFKVWRTSDFKCLESVPNAHDDAINAIVVSDDGYIYTGSADKKIKVWKKEASEKKHKLVDTLEKHKSAVNALALSPDGSVLYSGACDRSVLVWEKVVSSADETAPAAHMVVAGALRGHSMAILCISVVGDLVISGSADKTIRVFRRGIDGKKYYRVCVLEGHNGPFLMTIKSMLEWIRRIGIFSECITGAALGEVGVKMHCGDETMVMGLRREILQSQPAKTVRLVEGSRPRLASALNVRLASFFARLFKMANFAVKHSIMTREMVENFCNDYYIPDEVHPVAPWRDKTITQFPEVFPIPVSLYVGGVLEKDPAPHLTARQEQTVRLLENNKAPFRRYPECFLCLVGLSPYYPFNENTYPAFERPDETEMGLLDFIKTADPRKVQAVEVQKKDDQVEPENVVPEDTYLDLTEPDTDLAAARPEEVATTQPGKSKRKRLVKQSDTLPAKQLRKDHPSLATGTGGKTLAGLRQLMPTSPLVLRPSFQADIQAHVVVQSARTTDVPVYTAAATICLESEVRSRAEHELELKVKLKGKYDARGRLLEEKDLEILRLKSLLAEEAEKADRAETADVVHLRDQVFVLTAKVLVLKSTIAQKDTNISLLDSRATHLKSALDDSQAACAEAGSLITSLTSERDRLTSETSKDPPDNVVLFSIAVIKSFAFLLLSSLRDHFLVSSPLFVLEDRTKGFTLYGSWLRDNRIIFFEEIVSCIPIRMFKVELCLIALNSELQVSHTIPDNQFLIYMLTAAIRQRLKADLPISFAELLFLSCSSAEPLMNEPISYVFP
ncbi:JINGUBANG-like protein [Tanacetum coccineum]